MVHLVPKNAQVTSVGIPLLFTSYALYSLGRVSAASVLGPGPRADDADARARSQGFYNMSFGIGKIEGN